VSARTKARLARHTKDTEALAAWNEAAKRLGEIKRTVDEVADDNMAVLEAVRRSGEGQEGFRASVLQEFEKLRAGLAGELLFHSLRNCCRELGPVLSGLERMAQGADFNDPETTRAHVASFAATLEGVLRRLGIERLPICEGSDPFNANLHECVKACAPAESPYPQAPPRTVVRVEEHGYLVQGRLAVPARVWVQELEARDSQPETGAES